MKTKLIFMIFVILAALLVGCAATPETSLLEYQRTGGIAGLDDRLVIDSAGKATLTRKGQEASFTVSADELKAIQDELEKVNFSGLEAEYLPVNPGADLFDYRLTYGGQTVHLVDTAVPEAVMPVLDLLNQLMEAKS